MRIHEDEYQILNSGLNVYKLGFISKSGFDEGVEKDKYKYQILNSGLNVYKLGFISKSGFDEGVEKDKYNLFTLDDFYMFE